MNVQSQGNSFTLSISEIGVPEIGAYVRYGNQYLGILCYVYSVSAIKHVLKDGLVPVTRYFRHSQNQFYHGEHFYATNSSDIANVIPDQGENLDFVWRG